MPTLREAPADAQIVSHQLMLRAGLIRQEAAGIYAWLPLGFRVLKKIEQIVREEQDRSGALELLMPTLQLADLWRESGRYDAYGPEMLRIAAAEAVLPEGRALFPGAVNPDLAVEMPPADKLLVFQQAAEKGMSAFIYESERPHFNEAALLSGKNPEIEAMEASQRARNRGAEKATTRDPVLQRAIDVVTSLSIYQQR